MSSLSNNFDGSAGGGDASAANQTTIIGHIDGVEGLLTTIDTDTGNIVVDADAIRVAVELIDDTVKVLGTDTYTEATSKGVIMGAVRRDADTTLVNTTNEFGPLQMDANGRLKVEAFSGETLPVSGTLTAVTTVSALGTGTTGPQKAEDTAHANTDAGIAVWAVSNEANTARAADGDYIPFATDTEGNTRIVGNRDHDAVDAGEVVATGGQAIAHGTNPTAVAAADRTRWYFNRAGVPFVIGGHPNVVSTSVMIADADGAQTNAALVTVGAGTKIVVTRISAFCSNANTGDSDVIVGFGTASLPSPTTTPAAGIVMHAKAMDGGSGFTIGDGSGILAVGADNEDLRFTCSDPAGGHISITVSYYTIES